MSLNFPKPGVCKGRPIGAKIWRNDVTVMYDHVGEKEVGRGDRKEITALSAKSLKQMCFVAQNTSVNFEMMTTLTYPKEFTTDGKEVKKHLYNWLRWARRHCKVDTYFWVLEFQGRGAPHFHVWTPFGVLFNSKKMCSSAWHEIVDSGDEKHLLAGTKVEKLRKPDAVGRYAAKYARKTRQKAVPVGYRNVGRFWGNSYNVNPEPLAARPLEGWGDLIDEMQGWDHIARLENRKPIAVLYNAGKFLQEKYDNLSLQE